MALDTVSRLICLPSSHSKAFQAANCLPEQVRRHTEEPANIVWSGLAWALQYAEE